MLKTFDNYLAEDESRDWLLEPFWWRLTRNRRFQKILAASVVAHVVGIALLVRLDMVMTFDAVPPRAAQTELVQIAELAPPPDSAPRLRSAAEAIERADLSDLRFDPETANDTNLTARSPKPTTARGVPASSGKLPSASQIERQRQAQARAQAMQEGARQTAANQPPTPPESRAVAATTPVPPPAAAPAAAGIPAPTTTTPVPPPASSSSSASASSSGAPAAAPAGQRDGDASRTTALGFQAAEAQYLAYVRAKIRKNNEAIMPRKWIETVLPDKVSAEFEVRVRRDGRIALVRLARSSGYAQLDDTGRQAIYMANPFEGYPQEAGDTLTFTVTVHYTPGR